MRSALNILVSNVVKPKAFNLYSYVILRKALTIFVALC